ncbi:MAG: DUF881 domain-containing protein [Coriobacteriia bacterium]|nr:DUF881 domain-containing protein [Coriobacteriia bacterium]
MNNVRYRPALIAVIGVLGFLVAIAFNSTQRFVDAQPSRVSDLVGVVEDMENQRDELQGRLAELRAQMDGLEREAAEDSGVRESFSRELDIAREAAGLTSVIGPGVEVVLGDGSEVAPGGDPNDFLIHDTDVAAVVNALFAGGAEAVDINGERVVATTPIRCAGTTVLVNSSRLGSPYTVRAIGEPLALEGALMEDGMASLLFTTYKNQFGLQVSITRMNEVRVAAFKGSLRPKYAELAPGGAP